MPGLLLAISTVLQFFAAFLALRLSRETGRMLAWILVSIAIALMGVRRSITLWKVVNGLREADLSAEGVALMISILMVVGLWLISPLFRRAREMTRVQQLNTRLEQELSRRAEIEAELRNKSRMLQQSNADLEQFAYIASHDLQEPLRAVAGYCDLISEEYSEKLDQQGQEYLQFAVSGTRRMQSLITALLDYSRVTTQTTSASPVDCEALLEQVRINLAKLIEETSAEIVSHGLPTIPGDEIQLYQLFQNLVNNAIKFSRDGQQPHIEISCEQTDGQSRFAVRDNGIGIKQQYAERIFEVFHRLHSQDTYAGTGIGLAICKRVVERHGGRIWCESEEGSGTTFYFTIPSVPQADVQKKSPKLSAANSGVL